MAFASGVVAKMVVVVVRVIVAWLVLWRSWWRLLFAWRFVACLALRLLLVGVRFKITIDKEKPYLKESQPGESRRIPFNNGGEIYLHINLPA